MKTLPAFLTAVLVFLMTAASVSAADTPYRHVVLFKFKDGTTPEQVKSVEDAFRALPGKIDTIVDFEFGTNVSPEGKDGGFTHCFFLTFKDKAGLEVYLPHPAHKEFGATLRPYLDKVLVVDYVAGK
ncbi:Dabb family protein [Roseimicrobium sp. ORNL1]|uniref:Dabb family protein n=1 Tax=Roseimicrobium sp. ORNL1 TaxID=2711231 RepID=UPI0013E10817|nr:Dabb family protein [Roseimicrobium sp. ORNL1]QIF04073.1 Dabb family protein [Roseimicrobium sp. ORNL1]